MWWIGERYPAKALRRQGAKKSFSRTLIESGFPGDVILSAAKDLFDSRRFSVDPFLPQLPYESPLAPGEVRCEVTSWGVVISVGPRTAGQQLGAFQRDFVLLGLLALGALAF